MTLAKDERRYDENDFLHREATPISKAMVCEYLGKEINDVMLGESGWKPLEDDKLYPLLRPAEELEKAAASFNNLPILREHISATADSFPQEMVIGSTGTDCVFEDPYLKSTIVLWHGKDIAKVENGKKQQLSAAYKYKALMEPGIYGGVPFSGKMTSIVGNHVAAVREGRSGPDVFIGDSAIEIQWAKLESALFGIFP